MNNPSSELYQIAELLSSDPLAAADAIDALANRLHAKAQELRDGVASTGESFRSPGGMTDRVKMSVHGPDGTIKQEIDTGA